ncbi:14741_t:CDS:2 [Entrophospora sp. SA101]|nr:14741_t:CDS:2 [Entrophospora sp. SA101]
MNSQKEENIHLAYKKKLPSQFMEFCQKESTASLKCLDVNNYDRTKCQEYFSMYRECKKRWLEERKVLRREGNI